MDEPSTTTEQPEQPAPAGTGAAEPVATEVLVEEVSIDGMCGVY